MARRKRKTKRFGVIARSREKVERAVLRSITRPFKPFPEHAKRKIPLIAEVYRVRGYGKRALYQGWVCLVNRGGVTRGAAPGSAASWRRGGNTACGEAKGPTPTAAIAKAARNFARTLGTR